MSTLFNHPEDAEFTKNYFVSLQQYEQHARKFDKLKTSKGKTNAIRSIYGRTEQYLQELEEFLVTAPAVLPNQTPTLDYLTDHLKQLVALIGTDDDNTKSRKV